MRVFLLPLLERLSPLALALFLAGGYLAHQEEVKAVSSEECTSFAGISLGNDPSQAMQLQLCRSGNELHGIRTSEGIAGATVFHLAGEIIADNQMILYVSSVELDAPAPGWVTCTDDRFMLTWSPEEQILTGIYVSEACQDIAEIRLMREQF